jgi:DNA-binding GntR family transcriptional regulator
MDSMWVTSAGESEAAEQLASPSYQRVCNAIRSDIARGVLATGERLKLGDLTRRYGLSPAPIREALSQLCAEGWVVIAPNRGASVRIIDEALLRDFNEVRLALDSYVARVAADRATPADVAKLSAVQDEYEAVVDRGGTDAEIVAANASFHGAIHAMHTGREAAAIIHRQGRFFNVMRQAWGYQPGRLQQIAREHRELIEAFRRNDGAEAERVARIHIGHAMDDLLARWKANQLLAVGAERS